MRSQLTASDIQVSVRGEISADDVRYAREKMGSITRLAPQPVLNVRARLAESRATFPRVLAQANLDVNGRQVRAQVGGSTATEAVDLLCDRLWRQLSSMAAGWQVRRRGPERERRSRPLPRRTGQPGVVRRKSFSLPTCTVDEAAFEMNLLDYDFHLFTEANTGQDSLLYHGDGAEYRLAQVDPRPAEVGPSAFALDVDEAPAPRIDVEQAQQRLEITGEPFVFFVDDELGRGCVLYHRFDGDYGLITPVGSTA